MDLSTHSDPPLDHYLRCHHPHHPTPANPSHHNSNHTQPTSTSESSESRPSSSYQTMGWNRRLWQQQSQQQQQPQEQLTRSNNSLARRLAEQRAFLARRGPQQQQEQSQQQQQQQQQQQPVHKPSSSKNGTTAPMQQQQHAPPPAELSENESWLRLMMDLPGVLAKDVQVNLQDEVLSIKGFRRTMSIDGTACLKRYQFARMFAMDVNKVDVSRLRANLAHGVLTVLAPKKAIPRMQWQIPVTEHEDLGREQANYRDHRHVGMPDITPSLSGPAFAPPAPHVGECINLPIGGATTTSLGSLSIQEAAQLGLPTPSEGTVSSQSQPDGDGTINNKSVAVSESDLGNVSTTSGSSSPPEKGKSHNELQVEVDSSLPLPSMALGDDDHGVGGGCIAQKEATVTMTPTTITTDGSHRHWPETAGNTSMTTNNDPMWLCLLEQQPPLPSPSRVEMDERVEQQSHHHHLNRDIKDPFHHQPQQEPLQEPTLMTLQPPLPIDLHQSATISNVPSSFSSSSSSSSSSSDQSQGESRNNTPWNDQDASMTRVAMENNPGNSSTSNNSSINHGGGDEDDGHEDDAVEIVQVSQRKRRRHREAM